MKRFFFSLIALAAAAVSCTQSALLETPTLDGTPVSFSPYTGRTPVTKATSIATATELGAEGGFNVYCFLNGDQTNPLLADEPVTMTDGVWGYTKTIFWPASGSLDFVAYSANAKDYLTGASSTGFTFTVPESIDKQVDLLATAYQAEKTVESEGGNVTLRFHHLLSRIGFKVQTNSNKTITINSIELKGDMPNVGTLDFANKRGNEIPVLVTSGSVTEYSYLSSPVEITNGALEPTAVPGMASKYLMILPHTASSAHKISVKYTIGDSTTPKEVTADLPADFVFAQGKAYEFILKISTSALTFDVMEEDWNKTGDITLVEPFKPTGYDPDVDKTTKEEYGMVYNIVAYNPDSHLLTIKIDLYKNNIPAGANGFRISMKQKYIDGGTTENTTWNSPQYLQYKNGSSYSNCNTTGGYKYDNFTKTDVTSYYVYLNNKSQLPKNTECVISCYYYSTTSENNTTLKNKFQGNSEYQKTFSTASTFDHTEYYENQTTSGGSTDTPTEDPIVTIYNISVDQTAKTASVTGNFIDGGHKITSRGFCWMTGEGTPTTTTNDGKIECDESDPFSATITGLAEGINSCRAYVTTEDGNTHYSELRTIEIEPTVNEEDNTGSGSWGNGGNEDFN